MGTTVNVKKEILVWKRISVRIILPMKQEELGQGQRDSLVLYYKHLFLKN